MAQVFGASGRNAAEKSHQYTKRLLVAAFVGIGALALLAGYAFGVAFPIREFSIEWVLVIIALMGLLSWLIGKWATDRIDEADRERMSWRKGAIGEALVAATLTELPDDFVVVNDVSKRFGNIDHVVIGPTGVYVVDAKNWKGTVKAGGDGELLLNGQPPGKPPIKWMLGAVMDFQSKLKALTETDHFVRGLMVFPNAYVDANYGSTRQIHCLQNDRLGEYLQHEEFSRRLSRNDVDRIKRATLQLAGMDARFVSTQPNDANLS
jgi:hypothetical protein